MRFVQCLRWQAWSVAAKQQLVHPPILHQQMTFYNGESVHDFDDGVKYDEQEDEYEQEDKEEDEEEHGDEDEDEEEEEYEDWRLVHPAADASSHPSPTNDCPRQNFYN